MLGVGEFVGEIGVDSARVGIDVEAVSVRVLLQPKREETIKAKAMTFRYLILASFPLSCCLGRYLIGDRAH